MEAVVNELEERIREACLEVLRESPQLLQNDVNERTIGSQLARHLEGYFRDWHIDTEYNRIQDEVKRLHSLIEHKRERQGVTPEEEQLGILVVPDIIVHKRDSDQNLLGIEIKKEWSEGDAEWDRIKLWGLRQELGYRFTVFLEVGIDNEDRPLVTNLDFQARSPV